MLRRNFLILAAGFLAGSLALAAPTYYPAALGDFDGAADYLKRSSDLTGSADSKVGIISFWVRWDGGDAQNLSVLANQGTTFIAYKTSANKINITGKVGGAVKVATTSSTTYTASSSSHHVLASWDLGNSKIFLYINGADVDDGAPTIVDSVIDYTSTTWYVASAANGTLLHNGVIAELYFNTAEYLDLSATANRRLFISTDGYPVDLGAFGEKPTGTAPIIYMRERANNCGINSGTGGDFTINGAPAFTEGPAGPYFPLTTEIPARGRGSRMHRQELFQ